MHVLKIEEFESGVEIGDVVGESLHLVADGGELFCKEGICEGG